MRPRNPYAVDNETVRPGLAAAIRDAVCRLMPAVRRQTQEVNSGEPVMTAFATMHLPMARDAVAPDGSDVRLLSGLEGGGLAHFELAPGKTTVAVSHRTVEEIWFFLSGRGEMWRQQDDRSETVDVYAGVSLTIPLGTCLYEPLAAVGVTMPPWPGDGEAVVVAGPWQPTVSR